MAAKMMEINETEKPLSDTTEDTNVDIEEEEICFQDIVLLEEHGISINEIKKLQAAGINTIKGAQMTTKKKLSEIIGSNKENVAKIKEACTKISLSNCFITASEFSDQRKHLFRLSTGSKALDKLLGGGIESMSITEVFGEFRAGKTQLSHTLCVTAQMPGPNGYLGGKVIFIDTEHTFRPERLRTIADRFNLDPNVVQDNVLYARAYNSEHQFELLNNVAAKFHEEAGVFKLLIIDSIMALFRVDYSGRGEIADRQQKLGQMLSRLQKISEEYNIAVFITNQMTTDLTKTYQQQQQQHEQEMILKPIGGNILAHASTTRVAFLKAEGEKRIAKLYDSPDLAENQIIFSITSGGITDVQC